MTKQFKLFLTMLMLTLVGSAAWAGENEVYNFVFKKQGSPSGYAVYDNVTIGGVSWNIPGNITNGDYLRIGGKQITEVDRVITCNEALTGNISKIVFNHNGKSRANVIVHSVTVTVASDANFSSVVDEVTVSNPPVEKSTAGEIVFTPSADVEWNGDLYYRFTVNVSNSDSSNGGFDLTSLVFYENVSGAVDPAVTFANASETIEVGETVTNTLTKPNDLTVTFSSNATSVATVDEDGVVTGVSVGEATITASWQAVTDTYNAGSVSYTVNVTAATPAVNFVKVTNANQLLAGNEYILVGTRANTTAAMGKRTGSNTYRDRVFVTETDNTVAVKENDGIAILTLGGSTGAWTFLASDNSEYLALTANSNALHSSTDATAATSQWTITDDFQVKDNSYNRYIQYNSGANRFACYTSGQGESYLYVKEGSAIDDKADPELAFSAATATAEVGDEDFTAPTLSYAANFDGTIVYASSNEDVATVDQNGVVTIVDAGTTTISATSEETENFRAGSASYTLTVTAPVEPMTIADVREQGTGDVFTAGIVTSINGTTAYIQDETAAIVVYGSAVSNLTVGDEISVSGTLDTYNGLLEIKNPVVTVKTQDNTVTPTLTAIADISNDNQAQFIRIENATVTVINSKDVTIAQGENEVAVRFNSTDDINFAVNDVISLDGNIGYYTDHVQIANPTNVEIQGGDKYYVAGTWTDWATNMIEMTKNANGSYTLTVENLVAEAEFKIVYVSADGESSTWYGGQADGNQYWLTADNHTDIPLVNGANFYMPIAGTWNITVSFGENNAPMITVDGSWPEKTYYLAGDFNNWDTTATPLTKNADGTYTISQAIEMDQAFKIVDSDGYWYGAVADGDFWVTTDISEDPITMSITGGHNLVMKVENDKAWTLTFNPTAMTLTITGWPIVLDGNAYVKVTSTEDLTDGCYLIVYEGNDTHASVAFNGSYEDDATGKLDAANNGIGVTIVDDMIVANSETNAAAFVIKSTDGSYTIMSMNGKYIGKTAYANGLDESTATAYTNTISFDDDDNAVITSSGNAILRYNYASDQQRFRYYKTGQQPIALYKLTTIDDEEIPVTIGATGYGTLYYGTRELTIPQGVTAKYVSSVENGKIEFTEITEVIPAGTGVVISGEPGEYVFTATPFGTAEAPTDNMLSGSDESGMTTATVESKFYMLSLNANGDLESVGFYFAPNCPNGEAFNNGAHKAYLAVPKSTNGIKSFYLFNDEVIVTGINAVETAEQGAAIYNLNGQRVNKAQKGLYIMNGKKVVVK